MKKFLLFFILIFSVFFSYKNVFASAYDNTAFIGSGWSSTGSWQRSINSLKANDPSAFLLFNPVSTYEGITIKIPIVYGGIDNSTEETTGGMVLKIYGGDGTTSSLGTLLFTSEILDTATIGNTTERGMGGSGSPWDSAGDLQQTQMYDFSFPSGFTLSASSSYVFTLNAESDLLDNTANAYCGSNDCNNLANITVYGIADSVSVPHTAENSVINASGTVSSTGTMPFIIEGTYTPPVNTQGTYNESPFNGEVVATSGTGDVLVAFDYYLETDQDPDHDTAQWCMRLVRNDGAGEAEFCDDVVFDTYTSVSHTFTGLALDSQWDWSIVFTRPGFFIDEYSILHGGSNYFFAGRFTIDSTVQEIYNAYTTCSITDLAGCFQNAIVFLFYPSQSSLNDFSSLYDAIKNKPPFGYISAVQTALQGINDTETGVFTLETMPILDTFIFTPVRTALIWIMWLAFIFMFYHRLKNIHL